MGLSFSFALRAGPSPLGLREQSVRLDLVTDESVSPKSRALTGASHYPIEPLCMAPVRGTRQLHTVLVSGLQRLCCKELALAAAPSWRNPGWSRDQAPLAPSGIETLLMVSLGNLGSNADSMKLCSR